MIWSVVSSATNRSDADQLKSLGGQNLIVWTKNNAEHFAPVVV